MRLIWMFIGNAAVYGSLAVIAMEGSPFPSLLDAAVWLAVALTIGARWLDITRWQGKTASGEAATLAHWRRHSLIIIATTAAASVLAHAVGGA